MDDAKVRRKSVKSRRRSLRNLQPADVGALAVDQVESLCEATLVGQPKYGSIWIEQAESPALVRKPRRSVSCSQISHDLANSVIRNKKNVYGNEHIEKENFSPVSSPRKMVEDTPKRMPVLCPARSSNSPQGNCFMEDVWNQENSYEEIGVPRFEPRTQDGSVSEESLVGTIDILSIDETDAQYQDQKVNHSVEDELQISLDSFSEKEQNKIGMENKSPSPDQITAESLIDLVTSFVEESEDCPFVTVRSCSGLPDGIVCEFTTPDSPVEAQILNSSLPVFSGEKISDVSSKDFPPFSINLCQDFQQLDISEEDLTAGSDSETTAVNEDSDVETLHENTLDPLLASDVTFNTSLLDNSSLDQCCSQPSDSWCFVKCYPDEESSDVSALIDSSVSDGCDIWETDLSSAGSELSDSWCFSSHLNTAGHFNSTPCKTTSPMAPQINNDQCVEPAKHLIFATEDEIIMEHETIVPVGISSSVCITMEPSAVHLEEEEQKLPAIEYLNLEDSSFGSNEALQIQMQEESQIKGTELCATSNDKTTKDEFVKTLPPKTLSKKSTQQISDSKTKKGKPSLKSALQPTKRKQTDNSEKSSSRQPPSSITMYSKSSQDLTRKVTSTRTKKQATVNTKMAPYDKVKAPTDPNKLKSSTDLKKNLSGKREPASGTQCPSKQSSKLEENSRKTIRALSKQKSQPKAVSPDIVIVDSLKTTPQMNMTAPLKEKVKTFSHISKSTKPLSTEKRKALKGSSKSLPVETPPQESNLNQSFPRPGQQVGSKPVPVSYEEIKTKADPAETLSEPSVKKRQIKGSNASAFNQVSSIPTSAAKTKRKSLDSLATSTVTIRRLNTRTRPKSMDTTCDAKALIDLVPVKDKDMKPVSSKREKLRRRALVVPAVETDDVTVVDLEPLALTSSGSDCTFSDDIFDKVTTRRRQSIGSAYYSFVNDDLAVLPPTDSTMSLVSHSTSDGDYKHTIETKKKCRAVDSASIFTEGSLKMVVDVSPESRDSTPSLVNDMMTAKNICKVARGKRKSQSMGSIPKRELQNMDTGESQSESPSSEPVKILDDGVLTIPSQSQTTLRRSTRRRSIELSLSSNPNLKQTFAVAQGNKKTPTLAQSADKKFDSLEINNYDDDDERLREIYAKKPYVPISPSRLETIYSPTKRRGECNVFSKRKLSRTITFQPSEAQLKNRRRKAMRNWPFLFKVPHVDEKLHKLLNIA